MATFCNSPLSNLGSKCKFNIAEIIQLVFVATQNESGALNYLSLSNAALKAQWQAKFNIYNFSTVPLTKFVPSGRLYQVVSDVAEDKTVDENGYYEKLADGDYDIMARVNNPSPYQVKQLKALESTTLSVYLIDKNGKIFGISNGTNLYPIELMNFSATNYKLKTDSAQAMSDLKMRLLDPADINELWGVELSDGNPNSLNDFYSLQNCIATITTPATTGCVVDVELEETGEAVTGLTAHASWKFVKTTDGTVKSLAGSGSLVESTTIAGRYTVNESALLASGSAYYLQISIAPFDIAEATVTVP